MSLLSRIQHHLESHPHVTAAWLAGSRGRGTADDLSDIDIWVVVEDEAIGAIIADPLAFVGEIAPPLMHVRASSIDPPGGVFLLTWLPDGDGFQQVDWYWTSASTATRPSRTKLLFERRSIPVVDPPEPDRLDADALDAAIHGAITDSLLLVAYAWKAIRRDDPWLVTKRIQHASDCLATLDWLVAHDRAPDFHDPKRSFLPEAIPVDRDAVRTTLQCLLDNLASLVESAGREHRYRDAFTAVEKTISD